MSWDDLPATAAAQHGATTVRVESWGSGDRALLEALLGDPAMMEHLGGPETPEKIASRQRRYEAVGSRQYRVVLAELRVAVGWVGYWEREWLGEEVFEIGWSVLPAFQGQGIAGSATAQVIEIARAERSRSSIHAYPSVENGPSNAIPRKLGFTLVGAFEFEYPPGHPMLCNDWRLDLFNPGGPPLP